MRIKKLTETATIPTRGTPYSAGYDLYADIQSTIVIKPHTTEIIGTGLAMEIPIGYFGGIFPRSGLASKKGLRPANPPGVVDADYRGEVKIALHNDSEVAATVEPQERIAQLIVAPFLDLTFDEVDTLSETIRGEGGFGSTN